MSLNEKNIIYEILINSGIPTKNDGKNEYWLNFFVEVLNNVISFESTLPLSPPINKIFLLSGAFVIPKFWRA